MAKKPEPPSQDDEKREQEKRNFIEALGGAGMPLSELGLLLVPPLTEDEVRRQYGDLIKRGEAKKNAELVNLIWQSAKKSPSLQKFLSQVRLGWRETAPKGTQPGELENPQVAPEPKTTQAAMLRLVHPSSRTR